VTTVHTTLLDVFPGFLRVGRRPSFLMIFLSLIGFTLGLSCTTRGGMYLLQLIDNYAATYSLLIIGLFECVTIAYIYGVDNFYKDIEMMLGHKPSIWWKIMWKFVTPALLTGIMIFTWIDFKPSSYGTYAYPVWADALGWGMVMTSVLAIPTVAIINICTAEKEATLWLTIKKLASPTPEWGPALEQHRTGMGIIESKIPLNTATEIPEIVSTIPNSNTEPCEEKVALNGYTATDARV